jgi:hypothetical protein
MIMILCSSNCLQGTVDGNGNDRLGRAERKRGQVNGRTSEKRVRWIQRSNNGRISRRIRSWCLCRAMGRMNQRRRGWLVEGKCCRSGALPGRSRAGNRARGRLVLALLCRRLRAGVREDGGGIGGGVPGWVRGMERGQGREVQGGGKAREGREMIFKREEREGERVSGLPLTEPPLGEERGKERGARERES